jgi:hypothetical protein
MKNSEKSDGFVANALAETRDPDGTIFEPKRKGAGMNDKRKYERPELQRLGLLRELTKYSFNNNWPR